MSVEGVAIATIISQTVSAITLLIILCKETGTLNFSFKKLKFDKDIFVEMIIVGLPSGIQSTFFSISNMTIQSAVNGFGKIVMSGNATAGNLEGFVYVSMNSIQQAALNFAGQNYGAKKYNNIKKTLIYSLIIVFLVGGILGSAFYLLGPWLLRLYTNDPEVIKVALNRMQFVCLLYFLFGMMDVLVGWMRGLGYSFIPMIISLLGVCAFRVFWVEVIFKANPTLTSLYLSYPISWLLTGSVLLIFIIIILSIIKKRFVVLKNENEELVLSETKAC
jgi:Na+-driven multidrug efflux pump